MTTTDPWDDSIVSFRIAMIPNVCRPWWMQNYIISWTIIPNKHWSCNHVEMTYGCECLFVVDDSYIESDDVIIIVYLPRLTKTWFEVDWKRSKTQQSNYMIKLQHKSGFKRIDKNEWTNQKSYTKDGTCINGSTCT